MSLSATLIDALHDMHQLSKNPDNAAKIQKKLKLINSIIETMAKHAQDCVEGDTVPKPEDTVNGVGADAPILWAAKYGFTDIVKSLIAKNCNVAAVNSSDQNALHLAVLAGHADTVDALCNTPKVNELLVRQDRVARCTPLLLATDPRIMKRLLEQKAEVNVVAVVATMGHFYSVKSQYPIVPWLIDGSERNRLYPTETKREESDVAQCLQLLVSHGAKIDAPVEMSGGRWAFREAPNSNSCHLSHKKYTALEIAAEQGSLSIVSALLEGKADVNLRCQMKDHDTSKIIQGHSALRSAVKTQQIRDNWEFTNPNVTAENRLAIIEKLIAAGADAESISHAYQEVVRQPDVSLTARLFAIPGGKFIEAARQRPQALISALWENKSEMVQCFLEHKVPDEKMQNEAFLECAKGSDPSNVYAWNRSIELLLNAAPGVTQASFNTAMRGFLERVSASKSLSSAQQQFALELLQRGTKDVCHSFKDWYRRDQTSTIFSVAVTLIVVSREQGVAFLGKVLSFQQVKDNPQIKAECYAECLSRAKDTDQKPWTQDLFKAVLSANILDKNEAKEISDWSEWLRLKAVVKLQNDVLATASASPPKTSVDQKASESVQTVATNVQQPSSTVPVAQQRVG